MVAIVAGQGLGLFNSSLGVLGAAGQLGVAGQGRSGESVYINASKGNLVVQQQDEWLVGIGPDVSILRTYNSQGQGTDDNGDNWRLGLSRRVALVGGNLNQPNSVVGRYDEEGVQTLYQWDATRGLYVSKIGGGAFDTLSNAGGVWTWTDGDTGIKETYEAVGTGDARLAKVEDRDGNKLVLTYASATSYLVTEIATWSATTASGEKVTIAYDPSNLGDILSITTRYLNKDGAAQPDFKRVSYTYETYNTSKRRLKSVTVDLTPQNSADNTTPGTTYTTTYTYTDTVNKRLASIEQTDGSKLEFEYTTDGNFRINLVKETVGGVVRRTSLDYSVAGTTKITDALGQVTELVYETLDGINNGQLKQIKSPAVGGVVNTISYQYDEHGNVSQMTDARGQVTIYRYDGNGNRVYERNAQGNVVERLYSGSNLLLQETTYTVNDPDGLGTGVQPGGALTQRYVYDAKGNLRFSITPSGAVTEYRYNIAGQRISELKYPAGSLDAASLNTVLADFTSNSGALGALPAAFSIFNNQLKVTSTSQTSEAWPGASTAGQPLGSNWKIEFTTPSTLTASLVDMGVSSGTYGDANYRRHWLLLDGNRFVVDAYQGPALPQRYLGTAKANTTYVLEVVTTPDGGTTLYVYEKGRERASGFTDSRQMSGWDASPGFTVQGYSGPGAAGGTAGATNSILLDNFSVEKALESVLTTWTADKLSTAQRTDYTYNTRGQLDYVKTYTSVDASGNGVLDDTQSFVQYVYDQAGNLLQKIDGRGYELANLNSTWALQRTQMGYAANAASLTPQQRATLAGFFSTVYTYDGLNRVTSTKDPASGLLTLTSYNDSALQTTVNLLNGLAVTSTYDKSGRLVSVAKADGSVALGTTSYAYDMLGRLTSVTQPTGEKTYYLYDEASRKVGQIDAEGALTEYVYDANGQVARTVRYDTPVTPTMMALLSFGMAGLPANATSTNIAAWIFSAMGSTTGLVNGTMQGTATEGVPGEDLRYIQQAAGSTAGASSLSSLLMPVTAGGRYDISLYATVLNATASLTVEYYNNSGTLLGTSSVLDTVGGSQPTEKRLQAFLNIPGTPMDAPTSRVAQIKLVITKSGSTDTAQASMLRVMRPVVAMTTASQTKILPFDIRPTNYGSGNLSQWNIYDAAGRLIKTVKSEASLQGSVVEYRYDGAGRLTDTIRYATLLSLAQMRRVTDPGTVLTAANGSITATVGSQVTNIVLSLDADNDRRERVFYDKDGRVTGRLDAENYYTESQYDQANRLLRTTRYAIRMQGALADGDVAPDVLTSSAGATRPYVLTRTSSFVEGGADQNTFYIYNARGQVRAVIDAEGFATVYEYDASGNKTKETRYAATVSNTTSSGAIFLGNVYTRTSPAGLLRYVKPDVTKDRTTTYEYDPDNRLYRSVVQPTGLETVYSYDVQGNLLTTAVALGQTEERITTKRYDKLGRVTAELSAVGAQVLKTETDTEKVWNEYATRYEYDVSGHLIATITPEGNSATGNKTVFYYDRNGRQTHSINALGEVSKYTYNAFGELTQKRRIKTRLTNPGAFNGGLKTTALDDAINAVMDFSKDEVFNRLYLNGQLKSEYYATGSGGGGDYAYNAFGELLSVAFSDTASFTQYTYDRRGLVKTTARGDSASAPASSTVSTLYDAFGRLRTVTDELGNVTKHQYDKLGREILLHAAGTDMTRLTAMSYDAFGRTVSRTDAQDNEATYVYNDVDRSMTITVGGVSVTTQYDRLGQTVEVVDGRGNRTKYTYNADGQHTSTASYNSTGGLLSGTTTSTQYDKAGRVSRTVNAQGSGTSVIYDAASRVISRVVDDGDSGLKLTSKYLYDGLGNAVWTRDAAGIWTNTLYNGKGQVDVVTVDPPYIPYAEVQIDLVTPKTSGGSPLYQRTNFYYNSDGTVKRVVRGVGSDRPEVTEYEYDYLKRRTKETLDPDGLKLATAYTYDAAGNMVARKDALNQVTRYVYNADGQVTYSIDATGSVIRTDYDTNGRVSRTVAYADRISEADLANLGLAVTTAQIAQKLPSSAGSNPANQSTYKVYDARGQLTWSVDELGYATRREYDAAGNLARLTRFAVKPTSFNTAGRSLEDRLIFDAPTWSEQDRLLGVGKNQSEQYVYDAANRQIWHVDALGYATRTTYPVPNIVRQFRYANAVKYPENWDAQALVEGVSLRSAEPATGEALTRPYIVTNAELDQSTMRGLDALGREQTFLDAHGLATKRTYDAVGRLKTLSRYTEAASISDDKTDPGNATTTYDYDAAGQLIKVTDAEQMVTAYQYDKAGRLTDTVVASGTSEAVTTHLELDAAGRVTAESRAYGKPEQATTRYVLDAMGQRKQIIDPRGVELAESDSEWAKSFRQGLGGDYVDSSNTAKPHAQLSVDQKNYLRGLYTTRQDFDKAGQLTKTTDALNNYVTYDHDAFGNTVKVRDARGNVTYHYFDSLNRRTWTVDPMGYAVETVFDALGRVADVIQYATKVVGTVAIGTRPASATDATDASNRGLAVYVVRDVKDAKTSFGYDLLGQRTRITDAAGFFETMSYDGFGNKQSYTAKSNTDSKVVAGRGYAYTYDELGRVLTETGPVKVKELDAAGNIKLTNGQPTYKDVVTKFTYDHLGNVTEKIEAYGLAEQRVTTYTYDRMGRLRTVTTAAATAVDTSTGVAVLTADAKKIETHSYDKRGNLIELSDNAGQRVLYYYDALDRKVAQLTASTTKSTGAYGALIKFESDKAGNVVRQSVYATLIQMPAQAGGALPSEDINTATDRITVYAYDANSRLSSQTVKGLLSGSLNTATGNYELSIKDLITRYTYDAAGNQLTAEDGRKVKTATFYDAAGRRIAQIDGEKYIAVWTYDFQGNVLSESRATNPWTGGSLPTEAVGATLPAAVNQGSYGATRTVEYTYDGMKRVKTQTVKAVLTGSYAEATGTVASTIKDLTTSYDYNGLGQVLRKTEASKTGAANDDLLWAYDEMGREVRRRGAAFTDISQQSVRLTQDTEYNGLGLTLRRIEQDANIAAVDAATDRITNYFYDANGRLSREVDAGGNEVRYAYDRAGRVVARSVSRQDVDGTWFTDTVLYSHDLAGRQVGQFVYAKTGQNTALDQAGTVLSTIRTSYTATGELSSKSLNGQVTETATYDAAGQIVASKGGSGVPAVYVRDLAGNITLTVTPPADEQVADQASAFKQFFESAAFGVGGIQDAINAGAHANVAVFDGRNLQVDAYELTSLPVFTNDTGVVMARGPEATWIRTETVTATGSITVDEGVNVQYSISFRPYSHHKSGYRSRDDYLDYVEWTGTFTVTSDSPLPGRQYQVKLMVDEGWFATDGKNGHLGAEEASRIIDLDSTQTTTLTMTQRKNGPVSQDSGGVNGCGAHMVVYKIINPTAPDSGKVEVSRWDSYANGFSIRDGWGLPLSFAPSQPAKSYAGRVFVISNPPVNTSRIILRYLVNGAPGWRQANLTYQSGMVTGYAADLNLSELMSASGRAGYVQYQLVMVDSAGAPLELTTGDIYARYNDTTQAFMLGYAYSNGASQNAWGSLVLDTPPNSSTAPVINFIRPVSSRLATDPKGVSARIKYRAQGATTWTVVAAPLAAGLTSDWFSFSPAALGMNVSGTRYEVMLDVWDGANGTGRVLYTVSGEFTYQAPSQGTIYPGPVTSLQGRSTTFNFTNVPLAAKTARVDYKVTNGTTVQTGSANLVKTDDGRFYWDASTLTPFLGGTWGQYVVDYTLSAYDESNNAVLQGHVGRDILGVKDTAFTVTVSSEKSSSTTYSRTSGAKVQFTIDPIYRLYATYTAKQINTLTVYYRKAGTQDPYTAVVLNGKVGDSGRVESFTLDLSSVIGANDDYADLDFYYTYPASATADQTYPRAVAPTATAPIRLRVVRESVANATLDSGVMMLQGVTNRLTSNHTRVVYNAFGEVAQEFNAQSFERMRDAEIALGRSLSAAERESYGTTLTYNNLGLLINKRSASTWATLQSGFKVQDRFDTNYLYDEQGRLIADQDANGGQTTYKLLAAGGGQRTVVKESHRDGGGTAYDLDVFGDVRRATVINTTNSVTEYTYDNLHHLIRADKPTGVGGKRATDIYTYDGIGNRIKHSTSPDVSADADNVFRNGRTYTQTARYDAMGRVVEVRSGIATGIDPGTSQAVNEAGLVRTVQYEYTGATLHQTTVDESGNKSESWSDAFGHQTRKIDLGNHNALMTYNLAGKLIAQYQVAAGTTNKIAGQDIIYRYFGSGQIKSIVDRGISTVANYEYDRNGNKTYEGYSTLDGVTPYQRTSIVYDALNRISSITDYNYSLSYEYDKVGNRRYVGATKSGTTTLQEYWYDYDNMNRMKVSMGTLTGGRATSDTGQNRITQVGSSAGVLLTYDLASNRKTATYATGSQDTYAYTADGFLTTVSTTGSVTGSSSRTNDLLGRVTYYSQTGPNGTSTQRYTYLADGRVSKVIAYDTQNNKSETTNNYLVGNRETTLLQTSTVKSTPAQQGAAEKIEYYRYTYVLFDSALQGEIKVGATSPSVSPNWGTWAKGVSRITYDVNGHAKVALDSKDGSDADVRTITYVNNAQGQVLTRSEYGYYTSTVFQSFYYVDGRRVGESGTQFAASTVNYADALASDGVERKSRYEDIKPITSNFDQNYQPINGSYPAFVGSTHTVVSGETLESIALGAWGDASMWYLIAEANNILDKNARLVEGLTLVIPNKVTNIHNNSQTFKVYNPGEAMGDVSPTLPDAPMPPPSPGNGCGAMGAILMVVVAIAVTYFTAGALGQAMIGAMGQVMGTLATGAVAGAAGSVASQAVGLATGTISKFSWSSVATSAIGGAVTAGIGGGSFEGAYKGVFAAGNVLGSVGTSLASTLGAPGMAALSAVTSSVISQGVSVALGLQKKFSWTGVAASGVGAAASSAASGLMGSSLGNGVLGATGGAILRQTMSGMVGGWASSEARHERPDWARIAADAFGSAVIESIRQAEADKLRRDRTYGLVSGGGTGTNKPNWMNADVGGNGLQIKRDPWGNVGNTQATNDSGSEAGDATYPVRMPRIESRSLDPVGVSRPLGGIQADPGYMSSMSNLLGSDLGWWEKAKMALGTTQYYFRGSDTAQGAVQVAGGGMEVVGAIGLSTTGVGAVAGLPLAWHGGDNIGSGLNRVFWGGDGRTLTYQGVESLTGSRSAALAVDQAIPFIGGVASLGQGLRLAEARVVNNTVYRALTPNDAALLDEGGGIVAKAPNGTWTAEQHVLNAGPKAGGAQANSPWISTTRDYEIADAYRRGVTGTDTGNGVASIYLDKVPKTQVELWQELPRSSLAYHRAIWAQEVTVYQNIPMSAIGSPMSHVSVLPSVSYGFAVGTSGFLNGGNNDGFKY